MTRAELVTMTGSEEQADYALELLLKQVNQSFVVSCIKAEESEIMTKLNADRADGVVVMLNGSLQTSWNYCERLQGWNKTEEQQAAYDAARARVDSAETALYRLNRTISLRAIRA